MLDCTGTVMVAWGMGHGHGYCPDGFRVWSWERRDEGSESNGRTDRQTQDAENVQEQKQEAESSSVNRTS